MIDKKSADNYVGMVATRSVRRKGIEADRSSSSKLPTVAAEVWVAAALLHRERPQDEDFTVREIEARAEQEAMCGLPLRRGVYVHANQHCVANRPPNPARLAMLYETRKGRRRLYRPGDPCDPARKGGKTVPDRTALPPRYRDLLDWYVHEYVAAGSPVGDPILGLRGRGKDIWADETPDEYVRRLREGWA